MDRDRASTRRTYLRRFGSVAGAIGVAAVAFDRTRRRSGLADASVPLELRVFADESATYRLTYPDRTIVSAAARGLQTVPERSITNTFEREPQYHRDATGRLVVEHRIDDAIAAAFESSMPPVQIDTRAPIRLYYHWTDRDRSTDRWRLSIRGAEGYFLETLGREPPSPIGGAAGETGRTPNRAYARGAPGGGIHRYESSAAITSVWVTDVSDRSGGVAIRQRRGTHA
ncbi:MAG: hypothetical protein ACQETB_13825 [Halobacteriota archaeon]